MSNLNNGIYMVYEMYCTP